MFAIGDDNSDRHITPMVSYAIIGVNILVFLQRLGGNDAFSNAFSPIPREIMTDVNLNCFQMLGMRPDETSTKGQKFHFFCDLYCRDDLLD